MPSLSKPRVDRAKLYVCLMSFAAPDYTIREGDRLRGDHPAVQTLAEFFVEDGTPTDELLRERQRRWPHAR